MIGFLFFGFGLFKKFHQPRPKSKIEQLTSQYSSGYKIQVPEISQELISNATNPQDIAFAPLAYTLSLVESVPETQKVDYVRFKDNSEGFKIEGSSFLKGLPLV